MRAALVEALARLELTLDDGRLDRLCRFGDALLEQNRVMNLTAITDPEAVARLHFADSLALLRCGARRSWMWAAARAFPACRWPSPSPRPG